MSEEPTERLEGSTPFETHVLRALEALSNRLRALEEKVEARLHDTRPIWEAVLARLDSIEARLDRMDAKFDVVAREWLDLRADVDMLKRRPPAA